MKITIDQQLCHNCGICGDVCPRHIPETIQTDGHKTTRISPERAELCMDCGHCAAVCPHGAIQLESQPLSSYGSMEKLSIAEDQLLALLRQRRSVRRYKKKAVPRETIARLVQAAACAPTGTGRRTTSVIVLDQPDSLAKFSELAFQMYEGLDKGLRNPLVRFFITREAGKQQVHSLREFVLPGMRWYLRWYHEGRSNEILRDCPALLLFHSPADETAGLQNCIIAALQAAFMAETLGLGACLNDLIPAACNHSAAIRALLGLPAEREVFASLTLGYPLYRYHRVPPRELAEVRYLD